VFKITIISLTVHHSDTLMKFAKSLLIGETLSVLSSLLLLCLEPLLQLSVMITVADQHSSVFI